MKEIPLTRGAVALVDDEDYEGLAMHRWHISGGYAAREVCSKGVRRKLFMHRLILGLTSGELGDHINRNTFDNRRANLRRATKQLNSVNVGLHPANRSGFRGVMEQNNRPGWIAVICLMGRKKQLGTFPTREAAARAYDAAAVIAFGEFAQLNFPHGANDLFERVTKGGDANGR